MPLEHLYRDNLPQRVEDITAEWMTRALAENYPGTVVTSLHIGTVIPGTATKVRVLLGYNATGHAYQLPPTLWVKGGFIRHDHTYDSAFVQEAVFFADWAPHLSINIPKTYYCGVARDGHQGVIVMGDLAARNVTFGYAPNPISVDQQAATLDLLAQLHAHWWQSPKLEVLSSFKTKWQSIDDVIMRTLEPSYFGRCMDSVRGREFVGDYRNPDRVTAALRAQWAAGDKVAQCFSHGDAHLGNMFFEHDGRPGFLDWQAYESAPYAHDMTYSIIGNLTIEDRRANDRDLVQHYLRKLGEFGIADVPSLDEAWQAFRRHVMHGFMWVACPVEMQPDEICAAEAARFGAAAADLDTFGALGV